MATSILQDSDFAELQRRLVVLRVGLLLVVALLALRLWHLQIREGPYYRDLSENNRTRSVILEPGLRAEDFKELSTSSMQQVAQRLAVFSETIW